MRYEEMLKIGLDEEERSAYNSNKVEINKGVSQVLKSARNTAKLDTCYYCGKKCDGFCNSHSIPRFSLKNIAKDGKVVQSGIQKNMPIMGEDFGVNEAGTFHIICNNCDSNIFQGYEDPYTYDEKPSGIVLEEIALKNYLQIISKRNIEKNVYKYMKEGFGLNDQTAKSQLSIADLDLNEYVNMFYKIRKALTKEEYDLFNLRFYCKLDYVVPFAMQSSVVVMYDFENCLINDVYCTSPSYHMKDIHIAVFPLHDKSVVLMFDESGENRYRKFFRQFNKLETNDKLSAINYIIFSYCENVFLSKNINYEILNNKNFIDTCQKSPFFITNVAASDPRILAKKEFGLAKRNEIPNLFEKKYAYK